MMISDKRCAMSTSSFDRLHTVLMGIIFGKLPIGDRVRIRLVCKSWRDVLIRSDYPVKPEPPWLILPTDSFSQPEHLSTKFSFKSMSEERTYRFELPSCSGDQYRWSCCGSGGGWLLMGGRKAGDDLSSTTMILWDPISGTTKRLPALSTLPFFRELVDSCKMRELDIYSTPNVITRAQVFSVGSVECVVAVAFSGRRNPNLDRLALCSPQEQSWSVVPYGPDEDYRDVLFHNGHLYTICEAWLVSSSSGLPGVRRSQNCTVRLSCCDVEVTKLELRYDNKYFDVNYDENAVPPVGSRICERWNVAEHMVGSSAGGWELLVVSVVLDNHSYNAQGIDAIPTQAYALTRGFEVYGLDVDMKDDNKLLCCLERLRHVGNQCIFVGATGSTSFTEAAAGGVDLGNIIHFATNDARGAHWNNEVLSGLYAVHERGVFDVARDKIEKTYCRRLHYKTRSCVGWFTPKLC